MQGDIERILIPRQRIAERVRELARQITADAPAHTDRLADSGAPELTIVPILSGAMIFCADLIREMPVAVKIGLLAVSSYPGRSVSSQGAELIGQQLQHVKGRHVVLVDDILDSGSTLRLVAPIVREMGAASLRTCVLLRKDRPAAKSVSIDYVGFEIPDEFVVGYGLDFNDYYRNLPDIVTLQKRVLQESPS